MKQAALFGVMVFSVLALSACIDPYDPTPRPDYTIRVVPTAQGSVAIPPACPSWAFDVKDPYDQQPDPQFGCANARNLAAMVENPNDLVSGRPLADSRGVTEVGAIRRYDNNQSRGLIWTGNEDNQIAATTSAAGSSPLTGDITGGAGAPAAAASSAPASSP